MFSLHGRPKMMISLRPELQTLPTTCGTWPGFKLGTLCILHAPRHGLFLLVRAGSLVFAETRGTYPYLVKSYQILTECGRENSFPFRKENERVRQRDGVRMRLARHYSFSPSLSFFF